MEFSTSALRIALLVTGITLLVFVWLRAKGWNLFRFSRSDDDDIDGREILPEMPDQNLETSEPVEQQWEPAHYRLLYLMARDGGVFSGIELKALFDRFSLKFGDRRIYHLMSSDDGVGESVFSVANLLEPGHLDDIETPEFSTRGLIFFTASDSEDVVHKNYGVMVPVIQEMAIEFGARILDEDFSELSQTSYQIQEVESEEA